MKQDQSAADPRWRHAAPTISHLIGPEYHAENIKLATILERSTLFDRPKDIDKLVDLAKTFVIESWRGNISALDKPAIRKWLPAIAKTALHCIYHQRDFRVYHTLAHRPEVKAVKRVSDAYSKLMHRVIESLPDSDKKCVYHTLMRERYGPVHMGPSGYFQLDGISKMPDGWQRLPSTTRDIHPRDWRANATPLPLDDDATKSEIYSDVVCEGAKQSLTTNWWAYTPVDWEPRSAPEVTVRDESGTPSTEQFFCESVTYIHLLQSAVEYTDDCEFEEWIPPERLITAVEDLKETVKRTSRGTNFFFDLREQFDGLMQAETLIEICTSDDRHQVRYRDGMGCLVVHPDRPSRYLPIQTPQDIEALPCVAGAVKTLEQQYDEDIVMALIRLLRAVDGEFVTMDILHYFRKFWWYDDREESLKTLLSRSRMDKIVGCDHPSDPIVDQCIGQNNCPYRLGGSLPLGQHANRALQRGRREDAP